MAKALNKLGLVFLVGILAAAYPYELPSGTSQSVVHGAGVLSDIQVFQSSGTWSLSGTFAITEAVHIRMCGAGGGAGGAKTAASGGGASGAYVDFWIDVRGGSAGAVTIGSAGTAGSSAPGNGGTGGDSSIVISGTTYTAKGGLGSVSASSVGASLGAAGQSGSSVGDINIGGNPGSNGFSFASPTQIMISGAGGSSPLGSGGAAVKVTSGSSAGINPAAGNCGGGGGGADFAGAGVVGAKGTDGLVIVEEWR